MKFMLFICSLLCFTINATDPLVIAIQDNNVEKVKEILQNRMLSSSEQRAYQDIAKCRIAHYQIRDSRKYESLAIKDKFFLGKLAFLGIMIAAGFYEGNASPPPKSSIFALLFGFTGIIYVIKKYPEECSTYLKKNYEQPLADAFEINLILSNANVRNS